MTLQLSGQICITDLITECGGTGCLTQYYRGGGLVPDTVENAGVPTSGEICLTDFYGCNCAAPAPPPPPPPSPPPPGGGPPGGPPSEFEQQS